MPKIFPPELGQKKLFKKCLTQEEANYTHFTKPGGIMGLGIAVATNTNHPENLEPIAELSANYWNHEISTKDVLAHLIDTYGCRAVKKHIQETKPKIDEELRRKKWEQKFTQHP